MTNESYKNKILTELYNSGEVQSKVDGICYRNRISKDTLIQEDIVSEVFYHLSKFKTETLIEMYEDNPKRIVGLAVRIAIWKGVSQNKNTHKNSVARNILYASNLNSNTTVHDAFMDDAEFTEQLADDASIPFEDEDDAWFQIKQKLSIEENKILEKMLAKKGRGKYTNAFLIERIALFESIRKIVTKYKINV